MQGERALGKADLHMHSTFSDGYASIEDILQYVEHQTDLDVVAITDHDCIEGSLRAWNLALSGSFRVQVIVGAEISTRDGHLLALGIERLIPAGLSMSDTIHAVHAQGGFAVVAHPLSMWCPSATRATLDSLASEPPDGVEERNGSFAGIGSNGRVHVVNSLYFGWAALGGSDAHNVRSIGSSQTLFPGSTVGDLLHAIRNKTTLATGGFWSVSDFADHVYRVFRENVHLPRPAFES